MTIDFSLASKASRAPPTVSIQMWSKKHRASGEMVARRQKKSMKLSNPNEIFIKERERERYVYNRENNSGA
jgi:hypothetical protein